MRLSPLDGTFVELEDGDRSAHMHIGALLVFEPRPGGGVPTLRELGAHLDARIDALPRYRQRLGGAATGLRWPAWVDDERFDVAHHLHRVALPRPGRWEELLEWAGGYFSQRLDRSLPLWDIVLVEDLADGRWALATKTHHAVCDGVGAIDVAHLLFDATREPGGSGATASTPAEQSRGLPGLSLARSGAELLLHPGRALAGGIGLADLIVHQELRGAPTSSLNGPIGPARQLTAAIAALDDVKAVKAALGGTVNDVVLSAVTAGLRALLVHRGEQLPAAGLRAMVPMNVRTTAEHDGRLGNRISSLFVDLPVQERDVLRRYESVRAATQAAKQSRQVEGADALLTLAGLAPPVLHDVLARTLFAKRLFNLTVTNVAGPQVPLYVLGARLSTVWPLVPLAADHALGVAVVSYDATMTFGINADRDSVPDLEVFAQGLANELDDLRVVASATVSACAP